jgi:hypothetical protein
VGRTRRSPRSCPSPETVDRRCGSRCRARRRDAAIYLADGLVAVTYPVSAVLTRHHMHIAEWTAYTNCVVDAPAVPFMADNRMTVRHE